MPLLRKQPLIGGERLSFLTPLFFLRVTGRNEKANGKLAFTFASSDEPASDIGRATRQVSLIKKVKYRSMVIFTFSFFLLNFNNGSRIGQHTKFA